MEKSTAVFKKLGSVLSSQAECSSFANFCFKAKQIQCFEYILGGHDVIAVLPTGYGKSLIFHLLPWILPQKQPNQSNIVLVVCPLSSIIRDQVSLLSEKAHCVEIWGKEFRTDFSELAVLRSLIPELKFIAVTATATKKQTKTFAQTLSEKVFILEEIKQQHSRIRVLFATTALGMGVDAPNIAHVMHIGPPSSMEAYTQEIGRAGRTKCDSWATLFYNNNDIAPNTHTQKSMRDYSTAEKNSFQLLTNMLQ
ncbi:probable ATP-dependent DNA helicase RecS [Clytia hemisphaerica]|uniref:probable ATP-dependent DNA helicase RecS n=1 Tax=Clytia hemisphaerica TaxID=252671 RepID=UPI0034D5EB28